MGRGRLIRHLDAFWAMVRARFLIMSRYPVEFAASFVMIFMATAMFTIAALMFLPGGLANRGQGESGVIVYGFLLFMFLSDALWTIGASVRQEQSQGTLESLYLTPASKFASLVARIAIILVWTGLLSIMAILLMRWLIGYLPFYNLARGLYILVLSLAGTFGIGFAFAAFALLAKESAQMAANVLQFVFLIVCGMFFPFSALPAPILWVSRAIPLSYAVDAFRSTLMGYPSGFPELAPIQVELVIVTLFGVLMPVVGYWLYKRAERRVRVTGSLAQF